jgi:hypothetical protein
VLAGLALNDGTALLGSGPGQTVLEFSNADIGILLQNGTASVSLFHLRNVATSIFAYLGSNITVKNVVITDPVPDSNGACCGGIELNQGESYTAYNNTIDRLQFSSGIVPGIDVPFGGTVDIENNSATSNNYAFTAGSFAGGTYAYNDAFASIVGDWATCDASGCTNVSPPPTNISADPLYCPDFTLQPGSPSTHAGNPATLNPDGTRSDIGAYGGPQAVLPPFTAAPCVIDFGDVRVGTNSTAVRVALQNNTSTSLLALFALLSSSDPNFNVKSKFGKRVVLVGPGHRYPIEISFAPAEVGDFAGQIQLPTAFFDPVFHRYPVPTMVDVKGRGVE